MLKKKQSYTEHKNEFCRYCFLLTSKLVKSVVFLLRISACNERWALGLCQTRVTFENWGGFEMKPTPVCYWFYWLLLTSHCCGWLVSLLRVLTVLAWCFLPQFMSIINKYHSLKFSSLYLHFLRVHSPVSYLYNKFLDLDLKGVLLTFISFSVTLLKRSSLQL